MKTSGQSDWHTAASPPHMDGSIVFVRWRQHAPTSNTWFPGPTPPISASQTASRSVQPFLHSSRQSPYTLQWATSSPLQNCPFTLWIWTLSNNGSLGPPETISKTASRTVLPFLQGWQSCQTDRQATVGPTPSITIGHIYLIVRCGLITKIIATTLSLTGNCTESLQNTFQLYCHNVHHWYAVNKYVGRLIILVPSIRASTLRFHLLDIKKNSFTEKERNCQIQRLHAVRKVMAWPRMTLPVNRHTSLASTSGQLQIIHVKC